MPRSYRQKEVHSEHVNSSNSITLELPTKYPIEPHGLIEILEGFRESESRANQSKGFRLFSIWDRKSLTDSAQKIVDAAKNDQPCADLEAVEEKHGDEVSTKAAPTQRMGSIVRSSNCSQSTMSTSRTAARSLRSGQPLLECLRRSGRTVLIASSVRSLDGQPL